MLPVPIIGGILEVAGKLLDRLIPDPAAKAQATLELAKLQESGELARMANDSKLSELFLADTASARDRESKIATSADAPTINKVIGPYLAISIIGSAVILFLCMIFGIDETVGNAQKEIMLYILGVLSSLCTQVVSYFFGSSRGGDAAAQHIKDIMRNGKG
jgi:hypothetical protein